MAIAPNVNDKLSISQYAGTVNAQSYDGTLDFTGPSGSDFGEKTADGSNNIVLTGDQQAHHLPLRDADADRPQLCHQSRHSHLALMILCQHETAQLRSEVTADAGWQ